MGGGFYPNAGGVGNLCANVYTFDPAEEMVSCCACLVTPNALVSLSAKNDLINNVLTPAIPTSIVIKLLSIQPGTATGGALTVCNPRSQALHLGLTSSIGQEPISSASGGPSSKILPAVIGRGGGSSLSG
jgi:hypothetical protein